ncbi:MAG TPA: 30S ribosomal protein S19e [Methanoculleus sp.]|nr:30S ribosomal protein S19e [Methanoculleus sp.]
MTTLFDIPPAVLIQKTAEELKALEPITPPEWASFAKTGVHKQAPPNQEDWWYIRTASILRRVYVDGPVGVQRMRTFYGGNRDRGSNPYQFRRGSGSVLRKALQQLEEAGLIERAGTGRVVSPKGRSFIDRIANDLKTSVAETVPELAKY